MGIMEWEWRFLLHRIYSISSYTFHCTFKGVFMSLCIASLCWLVLTCVWVYVCVKHMCPVCIVHVSICVRETHVSCVYSACEYMCAWNTCVLCVQCMWVYVCVKHMCPVCIVHVSICVRETHVSCVYSACEYMCAWNTCVLCVQCMWVYVCVKHMCPVCCACEYTRVLD